jgi:hypothetical protein
LFKGVTILNWTVLFAVYLAFDVFYAKYVLALSKLQALKAANLSVVMYILTVYGTIQYVENPINAIPVALGAWLGTYLTVKHECNGREGKTTR